MSGYTNADGSTLVGAQKVGGQGQALQVDTAGNLLVNVAVGSGGSGSVVNIADPTISSNKLAVDATGKIGLNNFPAEQGVNLNQINGSALTIANPMITADQLRLWTLNGQSFSGTTGKQTAAAAITAGFSIFNPPASGKTILLFSLKYLIGNNSFNTLTLLTSDPAFGTALTISNNKAGSASSSVASATFANSTVTTTGTANDTSGSASNTLTQIFFNGDVLVLPAGNGAAFYLNLSGANSWCCTAEWIEF